MKFEHLFVLVSHLCRPIFLINTDRVCEGGELRLEEPGSSFASLGFTNCLFPFTQAFAVLERDSFNALM